MPNQLIADTYFKQNPTKILGTEVQKKRGDRGEGEFETIVKGGLQDALQLIDVPIVHPFVSEKVQKFEPSTDTKEKAKARAKALVLILKLKYKYK